MPRCCIVKNCKSGSRKSDGKLPISLFVVPTDKALREMWSSAIPEILSFPVASRQYICEKHFEPHFLIIQHVKGENASTSKRSRLYPSAVPTIFEYDQFDIADFSDMLVDVDENDCYNGRLLLDHNYAVTPLDAHIDKAEKLSVISSSCISTVNNDIDGQLTIKLPKMWSVTDLSGDGCLYFTHIHLKCKDENTTCSPYMDKCVLIDEKRKIQYYIHNKPVILSTKRCPSMLYEIKSLTHILSHFEKQRVCQGFGVGENTPFATTKSYRDIFNVWRHNQCTLLAATKYCAFCGKSAQKLAHKNANPESERSAQQNRVIMLRKKVALERRLKHRANAKVDWLTKSLNIATEELAKLRHESIAAQCADLNMAENEILAVSEMVSAAQKKDSTGHRYSSEWLNLSLQMSMRSPTFYNFLRDLKVLPLPCIKTVNKYASTLVAESGLDITNSTIVEVLNEDEHESCNNTDDVSTSLAIVK